MARPKKSKAEKIRELLNKGKTVPEIMKATGATPSYVYAVKSKVNKEKVKLPEIGSREEAPVVRTPSLFERVINRIAFWR